MLNSNEFKSLGISVVLILFNIALMSILSFTPVSGLLDLVFRWSIVGIIVYGGMLTVGKMLTESGIQKDNVGTAVLGGSIVMFAYGSFGAGLLANLALESQIIALGVTGVITTVIALIAGTVVYGTGKNFSSWGRYANYLFLGVLGFGFVGTLFTPILALAFISALLGFMAYLVYEIWEMRTRSSKVYLNAIGIYVAFMGVFIQILQIVLRLLSDE